MFNAKRFCNYQSFFFFSFSSLFPGQTAKRFLANVLKLVIKKVCNQGHTKKHFCNNCSPSCYSLAHVTTLSTVISIRSIQKSTRNSQKLGNKLTSRWQKIQGSKQREIELISKKSLKKKKREDVQNNKLFAASCEAKLLLKSVSSENV